MKKLVEVKYFEPAKETSGYKCRLDSIYTHPDRFRYVNCWLEGDIEGISKVYRVGSEGWFKFTEGKCSDFLGQFEATITQEIPEERLMEEDRFESVGDNDF